MPSHIDYTLLEPFIRAHLPSCRQVKPSRPSVMAHLSPPCPGKLSNSQDLPWQWALSFLLETLPMTLLLLRGSGCRPLSTAPGDALVRCQLRSCHLVDCRARYDVAAPAVASCPAGTLLWHGAWLLLSCILVHYSTSGGQGRFTVRELAHGAQLPVILLIGSYAGCELCCFRRSSSSFCLRWTHLHRFGAVPGCAAAPGNALPSNHGFSESPTARDTRSNLGDA